MKRLSIVLFAIMLLLFCLSCASKPEAQEEPIENINQLEAELAQLQREIESLRESLKLIDNGVGNGMRQTEPIASKSMEEAIEPEILSEIIEQANEFRRSLVMPDDYVSAFRDKYMVFNPDYATSITREEADLLLSSHERRDEVSYSDAVNDVDLYFRLLRYRMGHYDVLGGDKVFYQAKNKVMESLEPYKGRNVETSFLVDCLVNALSFVEDCHFTIDYRSVFYENSSYRIYQTYNSGLILDRDENGYFITEKGQKLYFVSCSDERASIVPCLTDSGEIKYSLILYCTMDSLPSTSEVFFDDKGKTSRTFYWLGDISGNTSGLFSYIATDSIAYIDLSATGANYENELAEAARDARNKKVAIIDLRSNGGTHAYSFIQNYLDVPSEVAEVAFSRVGMTNCDMNPGEEHNYLNTVSNSGYVAHSDTWTIVLVDNNTGCAPEEFMQYCRMIDNCIVIGTSTRGHLDGGTITWGNFPVELTLPRTGIMVNISTCLAFYENFQSYVGKGFKPDIYLECTADALTSVLNMLCYYNIAPQAEKDFVIQKIDEKKYAKENRDSNDIRKAISGFDQSKIAFQCEKCGGTSFRYLGKDTYTFKCTTCGGTAYTSSRFEDHEILFCVISGFWTADLPWCEGFSFAFCDGDRLPTFFVGNYKGRCGGVTWGDGIGYMYMDITTDTITTPMRMIITEFTDTTITFDITYKGTEYKDIVFNRRTP